MISSAPVYRPVCSAGLAIFIASWTSATADAGLVIGSFMIWAERPRALSQVSVRNHGRHLARCCRACRALVAGAIHCSDGIEVPAAGHYIHIAKRRSKQQLGIQLVPRSTLLLRSIDIVTGDIVFRADGPGKVEVGGRRIARGNEYDYQALRSGWR